jgi:pilus assembly protein CpaC
MKSIGLCVFLAVAFFMLRLGNTDAADDTSEVLKIYMGGVKIVPVSNPRRIIIGNPAIADVANVSKESMTLTPKAPGMTTLVFWDNFGEQSYKVKVFTEDTNEIKLRVDNLLSKINLAEVYSQVAEDEGKVLLLGRVKTAQDRERVLTLLGTLKDKTIDLIQVKEEEAIIDIDVQIMELNRDATSTLGFTWPGSISFTEIGSPGILAAGTTWGKVFKVADVGRGTTNPFTLKLDALVQEGKARILSRPRIACQSGKEAELLVGGEKPIFTTTVAATTGASGTNVQYKEFGIKLKIKPVLTEETRIKLGVNVEVSEVVAAEILGQTTNTTAKAYPLTKRNASTELYIDDGQTMVIGGLIKKKTEEDVRKTPFLSNLPVIGAFFRQKTTQSGGGSGSRGDTELFIILTPKIASSEKDKAANLKKIEAAQEIKNSSGEKVTDPIKQYAMIIQNRIANNFTYTKEIEASGYQGTVKLRLHLSYAGDLLDVEVKEPSGYQLLDEQAVLMAKSITSYPPFPVSIEEKELWFDIPITFQLK